SQGPNHPDLQWSLQSPHPDSHQKLGSTVKPQQPQPSPDEECAQEEDDQSHNARGIPPLSHLISCLLCWCLELPLLLLPAAFQYRPEGECPTILNCLPHPQPPKLRPLHALEWGQRSSCN
uniref:Uncharacterized protein n=1 Tax=Gopherus agassizii TaxID=38772 RepID=A0A452IX04_9SAUR